MNSILQSFSLHTRMIFFTVGLLSLQMQGQVRFGGDVYVGDNATFFIQTGEVSFQTGTTQTKRTTNLGKIQTANVVSFSETGTSATQHIDGYVVAAKSGTFTLPLGDGTRYAPITFTDKTTEALATVAFWSDDPEVAVSNALEGTLDAITELEFWEVSTSGSGKISLSWTAASNLSNLVGTTLSDLTIAAFDTTLNEWIQIPATPSGNVTTGSIISEYNIDYSKYSHFTFGKEGFCQPILSFSGITTTWNGTTWNNGVPTLRDKAVVNAPFTGSLSCHSLDLNANLTLQNSNSLEIITGVTTTNGAKVLMSNTASLVQRDETATAPTIELTKETKTLFSKRYVYWGTPIEGNFMSQINAATAQGQSGMPDDDAFDLKYKYVSGVTTTTGGWQSLTTTEHGRGFITRVAPKAPYVDDILGPKIDMVLEGTAGNGLVEVPVAALAAYPMNARSYNLLGNPYPSPLDAAAFLRINSSVVDGTIYIWNSNGASNGVFAQSDYYAWTLAGNNSVVGFDSFNGIIPSGQGFKVRVIDYDVNAKISFNNCMRLTTNGANNMFRVDGSLVNYSVENPNSFKVLMTNEAGVSSSILVTFDAQYTEGYDTMYDAYALSSGTATLYGLLPNNARLSINALPTFSPSAVVPMGVRKTGTDLQNFNFKVMQTEGVFASGQEIYLFDTLTGIYYNLLTETISLPFTESTTNERYELRFEQPLSNPNPVLQELKFTAWYQQNSIHLNASQLMKNVQVFDLTGRLLLDQPIADINYFKTLFLQQEAAYIIKVLTTSDELITQKLIINPEN